MRRRVRRVGQVMEFGGVPQAVEHDAGLHARCLGLGIDTVERVHVARVVKDHGHVDALAGEAGAGTARQNGSARGAAGRERGLDVGGVAREDYADGQLTVIRGIRGVKGARAEIEADKIGGSRAAQGFFQEAFQLTMRRETFMVERNGIGEDGK